MFRLEGFVDDKHIVKVMYNLTGLVMELKIVPVANAKAKNGKVTAKVNGSVPDLFNDWVKEKKFGTEVRPADLKQFALDIGRSANSYSSLLEKLREAGLLRKAPGKNKGNKTVYNRVTK